MINRVHGDEVALIPCFRPGVTVCKNLIAYCSTRILPALKVTAREIIEAIVLITTNRSAKTTGAMNPVDRGIEKVISW